MKRILAAFLCLLCCLTACAGSVAETRFEPFAAVIDAGDSDRVHLRANPSADAQSRGLYYTGTELMCESEPAQEWTKVAVGAQQGYIKSEYLRWGSAAANVQARQPVGVIHTSSWVNVRSAPAKEAEQVSKLYNAEAIVILGETATNWYYMASQNATGYVMAKYVTVREGSIAPQTASPNASYGALASYQAVLTNRARLVSAYNQRSLYFSELDGEFEGLPARFTQFAVADVDADGALEVIVKIMTDGYEYGYEILKDRAGTIYGYDLVLRAFQDPKADGTASYASSAFETGFGTLVFGETLCSYNAIAYSEADATGAVRYYANGAALSADAFDQLLTEQAGKPSVAWYDLTDDNLARILGA